MKTKSGKKLWGGLGLLILSLASFLFIQGCSIGQEILDANSELADIISGAMEDAEDLYQHESDLASTEEAPTVSQKEESSEKTEDSSEPEESEDSIASSEPEDSGKQIDEKSSKSHVNKNGEYTKPEDVALYIYTYGKLPKNYLTKNKAQKLGWISSEGNLWDVAYGMSIGGDRFGNREGLLPKKSGRTWYECDVNYYGGYRGSERILYSNDRLIFYTNDHYKSFTQLY